MRSQVWFSFLCWYFCCFFFWSYLTDILVRCLCSMSDIFAALERCADAHIWWQWTLSELVKWREKSSNLFSEYDPASQTNETACLSIKMVVRSIDWNKIEWKWNHSYFKDKLFYFCIRCKYPKQWITNIAWMHKYNIEFEYELSAFGRRI